MTTKRTGTGGCPEITCFAAFVSLVLILFLNVPGTYQVCSNFCLLYSIRDVICILRRKSIRYPVSDVESKISHESSSGSL